MKKIRIMVLALIVAVAMTGAGYAAWSTKITYNNTMKTANWKIVLEQDAGVDSLAAEDEAWNFDANDNYMEKNAYSEDKSYVYDVADGNDNSGAQDRQNRTDFVYSIRPVINQALNKVDFQFFNLHPGTKVRTRFEIRNLGSIPAKVGSVTVKVNGVPYSELPEGSIKDLAAAMVVTGEFLDHDGSTTATTIGTLPEGTNLNNLGERIYGLLKNHTINEQHKIINGEQVLDSEEVEVDPGLTFSIPASALKGANGENQALKTQIKVTIEFDFVQYNQITN